jgi:hypothetical protein
MVRLTPAAKQLVRFLTAYASMCGEASSWNSMLNEVHEVTTATNNKADGAVKTGVGQLGRARKAFHTISALHSDVLYAVFGELGSKIPPSLHQHRNLFLSGPERGQLVFLAAWCLDRSPIDRFERLAKGQLGKKRVEGAIKAAVALLDEALSAYESAYRSLQDTSQEQVVGHYLVTSYVAI